MIIETLKVSGFRNLKDPTLHFSPKLNLFHGANASGKSSLIESIHYLGYGRSFRTIHHSNVICSDSSEFSLFAELSDKNVELNAGRNKVGFVRKRNKETLLKINGSSQVRLGDLAALLPTLIFSPQTIDLVFSKPVFRRRLLDWGLFHVEHNYAKLVATYTKVLQHRNALLRDMKMLRKDKSKCRDELTYWDKQLANNTFQIQQKRTRYLADINKHVDARREDLLSNYQSVSFSYTENWNSVEEIETALIDNLNKDLKFGATTLGPHRADLKFLVNGKNAVEILSRGEQRMLMAGIIVAQQACLFEQTHKQATVLLDDISSELDASNQAILIDLLLQSNSQLFITVINKKDLGNYNLHEHKVFHVEHGHVIEEKE